MADLLRRPSEDCSPLLDRYLEYSSRKRDADGTVNPAMCASRTCSSTSTCARRGCHASTAFPDAYCQLMHPVDAYQLNVGARWKPFVVLDLGAESLNLGMTRIMS